MPRLHVHVHKALHVLIQLEAVRHGINEATRCHGAGVAASPVVGNSLQRGAGQSWVVLRHCAAKCCDTVLQHLPRGPLQRCLLWRRPLVACLWTQCTQVDMCLVSEWLSGALCDGGPTLRGWAGGVASECKAWRNCVNTSACAHR